MVILMAKRLMKELHTRAAVDLEYVYIVCVSTKCETPKKMVQCERYRHMSPAPPNFGLMSMRVNSIGLVLSYRSVVALRFGLP